ncbi:MAG TPA: response regulator [Actinomycetota bacterium]|nr:response regulator [Actinomycetota bacterium]
MSRLSSRRILVVEDEPHVRMLTSMVLEDAGFSIDQAADGSEALDALRARSYAAIVLDIMMPGVDGYQVLEEMQQMRNRRGTPVVVVTARHDPSGVLRELSGGAFDHLAKPYTHEDLIAAVHRAIEGDDVEERRGALWRSAQAWDTVGVLRNAVTENDGAPAPPRRRRR